MTRSSLLYVVPILGALAGCSLETERAACPCLAGHFCCALTNQCVPEGQICEAVPRTWSKQTSGTSEHLEAVWGSSPSDIHAVGYNGTLLHHDGIAWSSMPSPTKNNLDAIWGTDRSHIFAVGENGTVLLYDGSQWAPMNPGVPNTIINVWGTSSTDVFAVGTAEASRQYSGILHYDGKAWSPMEGPTTKTLRALWGTDHGNVFAGAADGDLLRYDGSAWSLMPSSNNKVLSWIWGRGPTDLLAGGEAVLLQHDGKAWRPADAPLPAAAATYSACGDGKELILVGELDPVYFKVPGQPGSFVFHHDGSRWMQLAAPTQVRLGGIWCKDNVFVIVGRYGTILRYGP